MGKSESSKYGRLKQDFKKDRPLRKKPKRDGEPRQEEHLEHIPFRLREIMTSKEQMNLGKSQLKKMRKMKQVSLSTPDPRVPQPTDIPVPHFRRRKNESEQAYLYRMNQETSYVSFLTKNQVDRQPELGPEYQEHPAKKCKSEKKKAFDKVRLQVLQRRKMERQEKSLEKEMLTDHVNFGEVAMAPPSLTAKPRKAPSKSAGTTKGLLLNSLLGSAPVSSAKPSMARQKMMEEERLRVVEAYRQLKKQKQEQNNPKGSGLDKPM